MHLRKLLVILLICYSYSSSTAQEQHVKWAGVGLEANAWLGQMIKHTKKFTGVLPEQSYAIQLNIIKQTYGQKDWQQRRKFPQVGVGLIYINYNMPDVYGSALGIYPNIQLPLVRKLHWEWVFNAGMGVGYVTKPFQRMPKPNLENVVIGGHWNNVSPFSTDLRWKIDPRWDVQAGLSFVHVSNASLQQPNLGINMWGVHIGLRYFPLKKNPQQIHKELKPLKNNWLFTAKYSMAFIEKNPADGPLFPVYMGAVSTSRRYWSKNKVYAGVDYSYNSGMYAFLKSIGDEVGNEYGSAYQLAGFLGNEFLLGRVGVVFQLGYYFKEMYQTNEVFYQKVGGNFYFYKADKGILKEVYGSVLLKTHKAVAELCELGIAVSF